MYRYLAKAMEVTLKAILDVSKYMFVMLLLMLIDSIKWIVPKEINDIFLYCLIMYLVINIVITKMCKFSLNKYIKIFISIFIIGISIIVPIVFINKKWDMYTFILSINFLCIATKSILYANKGVERESEITNFLYSLGVFISIFIVVFFFEKIIPSAYMQCIKRYLGIYFIIGVMGIARLNLVGEYNTSNSISINKDKNVVRVNIISCLLIILSVAIVSLEYVKEVINFVFVRGWNFIVDFLGDAFTSIVGDTADKIKYGVANKPMEQPVGEEILYSGNRGIGKLVEDIKDYIPRQVKEFTTTHIKVIVGILVVIFIIIIGRIIYKNLNKKAEVKHGSFGDEEKSFIFNLNDFKDSFKNLTDKIQDSLNNKKMHPIRKAYIQCVLKLNQKGIKYKVFYTPNEYSKIIQKNYGDSQGFNNLTQLYNKLRYGNKEITDEQINKAKEISDKL